MKNNYLFILILFFLIGCGSNSSLFTKNEIVECPSILFSSDHKAYLSSGTKVLNLDNIAYTVELNNSIFKDACKIKDNFLTSTLSILFIAKPIDLDQEILSFPYFIATIDLNKQVQDIQYYSMDSRFSKNIETNQIIETDFFKDVLIKIPSNKTSVSIIIGFMIDDEQLEIIN